MAEIRTQASNIHQAFAKNAIPPTKKIKDAEDFIKTLETKEKIDPSTLKAGKKLLQDIERQSTIYSFNATILASDLSIDDEEAQLSKIAEGIEKAEQTAAHLRAVLQNFS